MKEKAKQLLSIGGHMTKWLLITAIIGLFMGALSVFFLKSLTYVTDVRLTDPWLLSILPISGVVFTYFYTRFGENVSQGNDSMIEQGDGGGEDIPLRLILLTLFGTITTYLFGGSVGRKETAVQMRGIIANTVGKIFKLFVLERQVIIISGISTGLSSVSGTSSAGTAFGLEVSAIREVRAEALFPSFFAGLFANFMTEGFGVTHTHYPVGKIPTWLVELFVKLFLALICFDLADWVFSRSIVFLKKTYANWLTSVYLCALLGTSIVALFVFILNNQHYLGLSLPLLGDASADNAQPFDFVGELFFTVLSLGAGFQRGEVTPLSEIGAASRGSLALLLHLPTPFLAGLGSTGVLSGATNMPVVCFIMGIELFGSEAAVYSLMVCLISLMCSGSSGIYASQQSLYRKGTTEYSLLNALKNRCK